MRQTLFFLLMTMAFPSVQAFCDNKPCDTPFLCYERELCRFKENAKNSIALTMKQLTREYQQKLTQTTNALIAKHQAQLSEFEKQQRGDMTEALELTKIARESFEQTQSSMAATLKELTAQYQQELAATSDALVEQAQIRLDAFEQVYRKKMEAELKLIQLARSAAEKSAEQIQAWRSQVSQQPSWQQAISELSKQIAAVDDKQTKATAELSKQLSEVHEQLSKPVAKAPKNTFVAGKVFQDRLQDGSLGPKMVWLSDNRFRMGDIQGGLSNAQVHSVSVEKFALGQYEVTFAEYDRFADATGRSKPSDNGWGRGNRPVINVSWNDATAYLKWLSQQTGHQYRLPTEAQWEYAARAGTETKYWWGNEVGTNNANCYSNYCGDSFKYTAPVGSFAANPFGLFDTAGNVWEWTCSEWQVPYAGKEQQCADGAGPFVLRGGAWSNDATWARAADRVHSDPTYRNNNCGFRPARIK